MEQVQSILERVLVLLETDADPLFRLGGDKGILSGVRGDKELRHRLHADGLHFEKFVKEIPLGAAAASPSGRVAAKAMAAGYASGSGERRASGLLPGRVHVPVQPAQVAKSGKAVLPTGPTSRSCGANNLQINRRVSHVGLVPKPQAIGRT
jgi:hypothetical protein